MEQEKSMRTMETKRPRTDWDWFKLLKWWQKIIFIWFGLSFFLTCGVEVEGEMWPLFLIVGNFALSAYLTRFLPDPDEDE